MLLLFGTFREGFSEHDPWTTHLCCLKQLSLMTNQKCLIENYFSFTFVAELPAHSWNPWLWFWVLDLLFLLLGLLQDIYIWEDYHPDVNYCSWTEADVKQRLAINFLRMLFLSLGKILAVILHTGLGWTWAFFAQSYSHFWVFSMRPLLMLRVAICLSGSCSHPHLFPFQPVRCCCASGCLSICVWFILISWLSRGNKLFRMRWF